MFYHDSRSTPHHNERKVQQFDIELSSAKRETSLLHDKLGISSEALASFFDNPDNFTPELWKHYQNITTDLEEKLNFKRKNIRNPCRSMRKLQALQAASHWIHVK